MQQTTNESKSNIKTSQLDQDIVKAILEDHKPLKELIKVMKDSEAEDNERIGAFQEFMPLLIAHAKPEEEVLYTYMKKLKDLREEAFEGEVEHTLADQLLEEAKRSEDRDERLAKIKVLAELVEHHIKEEESDLLPDFEKESTTEERAKLGGQFFELKVQYLAAGDDNIVPDPKSENMAH